MRIPADRRRRLALLLLAALPLLMASRAVSSNVIVREDDVVDEDFFVAATNLRVSGVVEGDLFGSAMQTATIDGRVSGDVQLVASRVEISGVIEGGARIAADVIEITGSVADDVVLLGRTIRINGSIGRDLLLWSSDASVRGDVERETLVFALDDAVFAAEVGDGAEIIAGSIQFENGADFASGVRARSGRISGEDVVEGRVTVPSELPTPLRVRALIVSGVLAAVALMIGLWLSLFWLAPATVQHSVEVARSEPVRAGVNGVGVIGFLALVLIGPPIVGLVSFPAAALGIYVFGGPLFILFGTTLFLSLFLGVVPSGTALGQRLAPRASPLSAFVLGVLVFAVIALIPFLRWVLLVPLVGGVGALWLGAAHRRGSTEWLRLPPKAASGPEA